MKTLFLTTLFSFFVGVYVGRSNFRRTNDGHVNQQNQTSKLIEYKELVTNRGQTKAKPESSKISHGANQKEFKNRRHQFYKKENDQKGKVRNLLFNIYKTDRDSVKGELNMDIVDLYEDALKAYPNNGEILSNYSMYMMRFNRFDEARAIINKCLKSEPVNEECLGNSTSYALYGSYEEVEKRLSYCLKRSPMNTLCLYNKADFLLAKGDARQSLKYYKKLESSNGSIGVYFSKPNIFLGYATAYEKLKNFQKAKMYYDDACAEMNKYACKKAKELSFY